jgi:hypothetical protein
MDRFFIRQEVISIRVRHCAGAGESETKCKHLRMRRARPSGPARARTPASQQRRQVKHARLTHRGDGKMAAGKNPARPKLE